MERARARGARRVHPRAPVLVASDRRDLRRRRGAATPPPPPSPPPASPRASPTSRTAYPAPPQSAIRTTRSDPRARAPRAPTVPSRLSARALRRNLRAENVLVASRDDDAVQKPSRVARRSAVASAARDGVQHTSHPDQHAANMSPKKLWIGVPPSVLSGRLGEESASAGMRERSGRSDGAEADASPWHPDARCSTSAGTVSVTGSTSDHLEGSGLAWRYRGKVRERRETRRGPSPATRRRARRARWRFVAHRPRGDARKMRRWRRRGERRRRRGEARARGTLRTIEVASSRPTPSPNVPPRKPTRNGSRRRTRSRRRLSPRPRG